MHSFPFFVRRTAFFLQFQIRRVEPAVDNEIYSSDLKGDLRQQGSSGEASAVASRLVGRRSRHLFRMHVNLLAGQVASRLVSKSGMNIYRAVMITGPPGIGKTTSAHLCAKLESASLACAQYKAG